MLASPVFGQWGGGNQRGGGNRQGYYPSTSPGSQSNNNNNRRANEAAAALLIIGGAAMAGAAINQSMQPPRRPNYQYQQQPRQQYYQSQPQYAPSRPQYIESRPQYIESQPVERIISSSPVETVVSSETVVAPKPNVVKESPRSNDALKSLAGSLSLADGSAADPLLAVSTQQSVSKITEKLGEFVAALGNAEMQADWQKVVDGGSSAKDIADWWKKHGAAVNDPVFKALEPIHVGMSKFVQDLQDGLLSNAGKKAAIDKLAEMVSALPAGHPMRPDLVAELGRMRQFQKFGELLGLASVAPDPIVPILQGTEAMGMPVAVVAEMLEIPLMQYPVGDAEPLPSSVSIRIVNPSTNTQSVNCAIGGRQVEMEPGTAESLSSSTSVAFDQGDGNRRSVSVTAGTWAWKIEDGRWSLSKVSPKITIDNSKFKGVFHYTVNGKHASLAAGATAEHSHSMPIEISFDRGNGSGTATKVLTFGSYAVGIDTSSRGLELFRTDVQQVPPPSAATSVAKPAPAAAAGGTAGDRVRKALENAEKQKELSKLLQSLESEKR
jgi:hypothetical protein